MSDHTTEPAALEFTFPETSGQIRVVEIGDKLWFIAADVCAVLDIANVSDSMTRLDDDEYMQVVPSIGSTDIGSNRTSPPPRPMLAVSESGLYALVMGSRKPEAKYFRRWITDEVVPQIRKTGSYSRQLTTAEQLVVQAQRLVAYEKQQAELDRQQRELEKRQIETRLKVLEQAARIDHQQQQISRHDAQLDSLNHKDGCLTILAWWKQRGITELLTNTLAAQLGKRVTAVYRERFGKDPYQTPDGKFGFVNQYPEVLLDELLSAFI